MADPELKTLRLHAALRFREIPIPPNFPFGGPPSPADGDETLALYEPDSVIRFDPEDGPRSAGRLPPPFAFAEKTAPGIPAAKPGLELEPGVYGFLQVRAATMEELVRHLEDFARQAWWERMDCRGPYVVRRVFEDRRWATQIWRRLAEKNPEAP